MFGMGYVMGSVQSAGDDYRTAPKCDGRSKIDEGNPIRRRIGVRLFRPFVRPTTGRRRAALTLPPRLLAFLPFRSLAFDE